MKKKFEHNKEILKQMILQNKSILKSPNDIEDFTTIIFYKRIEFLDWNKWIREYRIFYKFLVIQNMFFGDGGIYQRSSWETWQCWY